jgi:tetratricopeptide (TPR) repeat protein
VAPERPDPDDPLLDRLRDALRGEYDVERRLGAGGMGYVYRGRDPALDMPVAIKVLRPELATARAAERFLTEARALAAVKHQNVVTIHRVPQDTRGLFLYVMELLGGTLADRLKEGPLKPAAAVRLGMDLLAGLERVHLAGIVHRDIKPGNVFIEEGGPAKIGDFGIAHVSRPSGEQLTDTGVAPGTPAYMAPEQVTRGEPGPAADLYAVAMVIYEAITGAPLEDRHRPRPGGLAACPAAGPTRAAPGARAGSRGPLARCAHASVMRWPPRCGGAARWWSRLSRPRPRSRPEPRSRYRGGSTPPAAHPVGRRGAAVRCGERSREDGRAARHQRRAGSRHGLGRLGVPGHAILPHAPVRQGARARLASGRHVGAAACDPHPAWPGRDPRRLPDRDARARGTGRDGPRPGTGAGADRRIPRIGFRLAQAATRVLEPRHAARFVGYRSGEEDAATAAFIDGAYAFEQDNWAAAEAAFRDAIAADSNYGDAWWGLYKVQAGARAPHEVDLAGVYRRYGDQFSDLDRLLIQAELASTIPERITLYRAAIERAPYDAYPRLMLGNELFHRGALTGQGYASAIDVLNGAADANPYLAATYSMLAWAYVRLGDSARARQALERHRAYGRPTPEADFGMAEVLDLARLARFDFPTFLKHLEQTNRSPDGPASLARAVRLGLAFGIPDAQEAIGRALQGMRNDTLRLIGLTAQAPALLSKGRVAEALARLEEAGGVFRDPEYRFQAAQWALILPALGVPGVPPEARDAARARMGGWASDGPRVTRARWTLLLDALATDTASAEQRLTSLRESADAPALVDLGAALLTALRGDTAAALRLSDSLTLRVVAAQVADPLQRAVLFLSRGRWLAGRDRARADAAWQWYENADFVGWPTGALQAAEVDGALETWARYVRAERAVAARDQESVCRLAPDAIARWTDADSAYAPLRASLRAWARACSR